MYHCAKGLDGCVITSDTRVMRDFEASNATYIIGATETARKTGTTSSYE
jgi:hypothetical protein